MLDVGSRLGLPQLCVMCNPQRQLLQKDGLIFNTRRRNESGRKRVKVISCYSIRVGFVVFSVAALYSCNGNVLIKIRAALTSLRHSVLAGEVMK